jgi:hypothetical protein
VEKYKSIIGGYSALVNLGQGDRLIALRAYLDGSGKLESDFITLAAVSANDDIWSKFEVEWDKILGGHTPKAKYTHMREILRSIEGFNKSLGWDLENGFGLVNKCLIYMSSLDKKRFCVFYCTVDLKAWRKLRAETYQLPEPIDMCNTFCTEAVGAWYLRHYPDLLDPNADKLRYFFDRNEYFYQPFYDKWKREKDLVEQTGVWTVWATIDQVSPVEMKTTPGIQAADIVAWGARREPFVQEGQAGRYLGQIIRSVMPSYSIFWDEAKMREQFKPLIYT